MNKRSLPFLALFLVGCLQPGTSLVEKPQPKKLTPVSPPTSQVVNQLEVSLDGNVVSNLHRYFGNSNTVTIQDKIVIQQDKMTVSIPAGANFSYVFSEEKGVVTFNDPKPVVTVVEWGMKINPKLEQVLLTPPNKGVATVKALGMIPVKRSFNLNWDSPPPELPESVKIEEKPVETLREPAKPQIEQRRTLPILWMFGDFSEKSSCQFCRIADRVIKEHLAAGKTLPFEVVRNPEGVMLPNGRGTPFFCWGKEDVPDKNMDHNWKIEGWPGIDHLIKEFNKSRAPKKAAAVARSRCIRGLASFGFSSPWVEARYGYTTVHHLVHDHGVDYSALKPYLNDRDALNRIHGWCHLREMRM